MTVELITRTRACDTLVKLYWMRPFAWGTSDCVRLGADLRIAAGLTDPLKDIPKYRTLTQAKRVLKDLGHETFEEAVTSKLEVLDSPLWCLPGDIVTIMSRYRNMPALGVFLAPDAVLCFVDGVCQRVDMQFATGSAWRLG